jgi:hypothetical protein
MHRAAIDRHLSNQVTKTVTVGRGCRDGDPLAALVEHTDVQSFPAEIESEVQHGVWGPPW